MKCSTKDYELNTIHLKLASELAWTFVSHFIDPAKDHDRTHCQIEQSQASEYYSHKSRSKIYGQNCHEREIDPKKINKKKKEKPNEVPVTPARNEHCPETVNRCPN